MNIVRLNAVSLNRCSLNLVGKKTRKGSGGGGGGGSDAPEGYGNFITADDMVFSASDGKFYVKL